MKTNKKTENKSTKVKNFSSLTGLVIIFSIFILILSSGFVLADETEEQYFHGDNLEYAPLSPLPNVSGENNATTTSLGSYLKNIYNLIIGLSAVLAVLMIVIGGIEYMTSEVVGKKESAKDKITGAIFGLVLVFSSWLLLYVINPNLVNFSLNLKKVEFEYTKITTPGWYCEIDGKPGEYQGPWSSEDSCNSRKDDCGKCVEFKQEDIGSSYQGVKYITKLFNDGVSGWYYEYRFNSEKEIGPFETETECIESKNDSIFKGREIIKDCGIKLGTSDEFLLSILQDEINTKIKIESGDVEITSTGVEGEYVTCDHVGQEKCTNVGMLNEKTIKGVKKIKERCPDCDVTITAGTEWWLHGKALSGGDKRDINSNSTHHKPKNWAGPNSAIDLRLESKLNDFIHNSTGGKYTDTGTGNGQGLRYEVTSETNETVPIGTYLKEYQGGQITHWHVEFK